MLLCRSCAFGRPAASELIRGEVPQAGKVLDAAWKGRSLQVVEGLTQLSGYAHSVCCPRDGMLVG